MKEPNFFAIKLHDVQARVFEDVRNLGCFFTISNHEMAQHLDVVQLNVHYKALVQRVREKDILVEIDELLASSQGVCPSVVGRF